MKLWLKQEQKSVHVNIFSVLLLSDKEELQRYLQMNTKSYDWSWVNFCTLIIYISYINCTSTNRSCIAYYIIYSFLQILIAQDYLRLRLTKFHVWRHGMTCALGIKSNGRHEHGHVKSCPLTTKNIIFKLPQCLWLPQFAGS